MSPLKIRELLDAVDTGQTELLTVVDQAVEQLIFEGNDSELEQAVEIIENFLFTAIPQEDISKAA